MKTFMYTSIWYVAQFFLEWEMFQTKVVQKIKNAYFTFNNSFPENRAIYEIIYKNTVQSDRPHMTI